MLKTSYSDSVYLNYIQTRDIHRLSGQYAGRVSRRVPVTRCCRVAVVDSEYSHAVAIRRSLKLSSRELGDALQIRTRDRHHHQEAHDTLSGRSCHYLLILPRAARNEENESDGVPSLVPSLLTLESLACEHFGSSHSPPLYHSSRRCFRVCLCLVRVARPAPDPLQLRATAAWRGGRETIFALER